MAENSNNTSQSASSFNNDPARYQFRRPPTTASASQPLPPPGFPMQTAFGTNFRFRPEVDIAFGHLYQTDQTFPPVDQSQPQALHRDSQSPFGFQGGIQMQVGTMQSAQVPPRASLPASAAAQSSNEELEDQDARPEEGRMHSVEEARAWRRPPMYRVTHPHVPAEFESNKEYHVTRIYNAMANCKAALDGQRYASAGKDQEIRGSKGFKGMSSNAFKHREAEAASWIIWGNLLALHRNGSTLTAPVDFGHNLKSEQNDLDLTIEERLDAVLKLLRSFKTCCLDAMGRDERKIQIMVRAPVAIHRTKKQYQASNDTRKAVYARGKKDLPPKKKDVKKVRTEVKVEERNAEYPFDFFANAHSANDFWPSLISPMFSWSASALNALPQAAIPPEAVGEVVEDDDVEDEQDEERDGDEDEDYNPERRKRPRRRHR